MHSCLYEGTVYHHRRVPVVHAFQFRVFMLYLDLDEVDQVFAHRLLWSARRPAYARWRRSDHPGDPAVPLDRWVRQLVAARTGTRPDGPVRLLTHCRYAGKGFNPISVYYCFDSDGAHPRWAVLEVTSTPWRERTHHVIDLHAEPGTHDGRVAKALHVSPFLPMDLEYRWRLSAPGDRVTVGIDALQDGLVVLRTGLAMRRRAPTRRAMARLLVTHPPMSVRVLGGIYWQAFRLWRKRVPYHPHPRRISEEDAAA